MHDYYKVIATVILVATHPHTIDPLHPSALPTNPFPLVANNLFSGSRSLFLFCFAFFLVSTYKRNHIAFSFFCLTYFTYQNTLKVHLCCCK